MFLLFKGDEHHTWMEGHYVWFEESSYVVLFVHFILLRAPPQRIWKISLANEALSYSSLLYWGEGGVPYNTEAVKQLGAVGIRPYYQG